MGTILISENVSLDGVIQDPAGDEGFRVGGWVGLIKDSPQRNKIALDEALSGGRLLRGTPTITSLHPDNSLAHGNSVFDCLPSPACRWGRPARRRPDGSSHRVPPRR